MGLVDAVDCVPARYQYAPVVLYIPKSNKIAFDPQHAAKILHSLHVLRFRFVYFLAATKPRHYCFQGGALTKNYRIVTFVVEMPVL